MFKTTAGTDVIPRSFGPGRPGRCRCRTRRAPIPASAAALRTYRLPGSPAQTSSTCWNSARPWPEVSWVGLTHRLMEFLSNWRKGLVVESRLAGPCSFPETSPATWGQPRPTVNSSR